MAESETLDLAGWISDETGPLWGTATEQLNATFLSWRDGHEIAAHVNNEVDVVMIVISGEGEVEVDGKTQTLKPGSLVVLPKGTERAVRARSTPFSYVNVHQRRSLKLTTPPPRS